MCDWLRPIAISVSGHHAISESVIAKERLAFEEAIRKVEAEEARRAHEVE